MRVTEEWLLDRVAVSPESGCWIWLGADSGQGKRGSNYPKMGFHGGWAYVHRIVYHQLVKPIRPGQQVDHLCARWGKWDPYLTRRCVCPQHLEAVSHLVNQRRKQR
jgi:hypothetical protein